MCVNLHIQWCEAAGLWLSVEQHTHGRQNYTRFKCCFGHLAEMVQNGATMGGTLALNCTRLLLPAVTFLRTYSKCNMCKCTVLFHHPSVKMCFILLRPPTLDVVGCDRKRVIVGCAQADSHAYSWMCVYVSLVELWTKGLN